MSSEFIISCESTADIEYSFFEKRKIPVIFYHYIIDGEEFPDNMGRNKRYVDEFYNKMSKNILPTTSQINEYNYYEFFKSIIKENKKILHIAFGSGMTPSVNNAVSAAEKINEELNEDKITVIDSKCSSGGYGLLVALSYEFMEKGNTLENTVKYINSVSYKIHHQFFATEMKYLKRSGRVSGATATVATILGICPIMHLNKEGKIIAYARARGKRKAIEFTLDEMINHAENGLKYDGLCFINHSNCLEDAKLLKKEIESKFKNLKNKVQIRDIGTVVATHCGAGTVALFFVGDERE